MSGIKPSLWWTPKSLAWKFLGLLAAALAGAAVNEVVVPAFVPSLEALVFDTTGMSTHPRFLVTASTQELTGRANLDLGFYRVFCGFHATAAKFCVMREVQAKEGEPPEKWSFDKTKHTKAVFLGEGTGMAYMSWISTQNGRGGSAIMPYEFFNSSTLVGYGSACEQNSPVGESVTGTSAV
jgi:hypothetical protein